MIATLQRLPKSTILLTLTIPWNQVKTAYDETIQELAQEIQIKGFRKGKAPKKLVLKAAGRDKVYGRTIQKILPQLYAQAVKEHGLNPIVTPKVEVIKIEEGKDWIFQATTAEKPEIDLGNYQEKIRQAKKPKASIWLPGQANEPKKKEETRESRTTRVLAALLESAKIEIPDILLENEVNKRLAQTLDEIKKLGLTLESYLASVQKTPESLREESQKQAERALKLEFILEEVAEKENITVEEDDIRQFLQKVGEDKTRKALEKDRYFLAHLLRRQKTIDKLLSL